LTRCWQDLPPRHASASVRRVRARRVWCRDRQPGRGS